MKMKRFSKIVAVTCVAALALAVVSAAGAQAAARFTASAAGKTIKGVQNGDQTFTASSSAPAVICHKAATEGTTTGTEATSQEVTVHYTECHVATIGSPSATVSKATYDLAASGSVTITEPIEIAVSALGCHTTVEAQTVGSASYDNLSGGKIEQTSAVTGIHSTSSGGLCPSGTTGTYSGNNIVELPGGTISWDAS
jgi:hypothetical protein